MKISFLAPMFLLALLGSTAQTSVNNGSLEGIVRNAETREPMAAVEVTLQAGGETIAAAMVTRFAPTAEDSSRSRMSPLGDTTC